METADIRTDNARLNVGSVVVTAAALRQMLVNDVDPYTLLNRHATGDWSEMDDDDQAVNRRAAANGLRVFASYYLNETQRVWIITDADRETTTFLLPSEC